jgi:hypothetical protein
MRYRQSYLKLTSKIKSGDNAEVALNATAEPGLHHL